MATNVLLAIALLIVLVGGLARRRRRADRPGHPHHPRGHPRGGRPRPGQRGPRGRRPRRRLAPPPRRAGRPPRAGDRRPSATCARTGPASTASCSSGSARPSGSPRRCAPPPRGSSGRWPTPRPGASGASAWPTTSCGPPGSSRASTTPSSSTLPDGTRPDVTFLLPDDRLLHMDVKFPLAGYLRWCEAATDAERADGRSPASCATSAHRVKELARPGYADERTLRLRAAVHPQRGGLRLHPRPRPRPGRRGPRPQVVLCSPFTLFAVLGVIRQAADAMALQRGADEVLDAPRRLHQAVGPVHRAARRPGQQPADGAQHLRAAQRAPPPPARAPARPGRGRPPAPGPRRRRRRRRPHAPRGERLVIPPRSG